MSAPSPRRGDGAGLPVTGAPVRSDDGADPGAPAIVGTRAGALLVALPAALAVDFATLVVLERGAHAGRALSIGLAFVVTVAVWGLGGRVVEARLRRRGGAS